MLSQLLAIFIVVGDDVQFYVYGNRKIQTPTDSSFDFKCQLPNEEPEAAFCGPEALRDVYRIEFYSKYLEYFLSQRESLDFWNLLSNNSQSRCSRAQSSVAHPFTCHFTSDQIGKYVRSTVPVLFS